MAISSVPVTEANIATFRRAIDEGWNKGNLAAIDELFTPDFVEHQAGIAGGRDGVKSSIQSLRTAFPDLHLTVEDAIAQGDLVWLRLSATGTHEGPFMGTLATGRRIDITVIDIARVVDGRLVEHWGVADRLSVAQQIGLVPAGAADSRASPTVRPKPKRAKRALSAPVSIPEIEAVSLILSMAGRSSAQQSSPSPLSWLSPSGCRS